MFRDVFSRLYVPIAFGTVNIDPFTLTDLNQNQIEWLVGRPEDLSIFIDQFVDIFDFGGGIGRLGDFKRPPEPALDMFQLATFQFQAATAALRLAFDFRGAIQSSLIATELAMKAGLAAAGVAEGERRKHGHNLLTMAEQYALAMPRFDLPRVTAAIQRMPAYVENRYSPNQPSRVETGHIAMNAQYIGAEVMRQVTGYSIRDALTGVSARTYPPM